MEICFFIRHAHTIIIVNNKNHFMLQISYKSITRGFGILLFLALVLGCQKEVVPPNPTQFNSSAVINPDANNLESTAIALSQTRTATLLNYNFKEMGFLNTYPRATATDVQADDDVYATSRRMSKRHNGATLTLQGFGFDIPAAATIENIIIKVRRLKVGSATVSEYFVSLGLDHNSTPDFPQWWYGVYWIDSINTIPTNLIQDIETEKTYAQVGSGNGGNNGNRPYQWTPTMINDTSFGVELFVGVSAMQPFTGAHTVKYDYAEITVEYSLP
jgi:hypothetical protein